MKTARFHTWLGATAGAMLCCSSLPLKGEGAHVVRRTESQVISGQTASGKKIEVKIPYGEIIYRGIFNPVSKGVDNLQFGLKFQRPPKTNGGWDGWNFLRVTTIVNHRPVQIFKRWLLEDAEVLETGQRTLVQFHWPLDDAGTAMVVTTIQYPTHPDWIFVRLSMRGESAFLDTIDLSCFPGNTSGPPERERWLASLHREDAVNPRGVPFGPEDDSFVFFNQMAQTNSGCLLVIAPHIPESLSIFGQVQTRVKCKPETQEMCFALGGYDGRSTEEVIRVFRMEGAANTRNFLNDIDWTPRLETEAHERLIRNLEQILAESKETVSSALFQKLKDDYLKARDEQRNEDAIRVVQQLSELKEQSIRSALQQWK